MFLLKYHVRPIEDRADLEEVGAFVNCWIERRSIEEAREVAQEAIREEGYVVVATEEEGEVLLEESGNGRKYFEQALVDKEVLVFHTYPRREIQPE